MRLSLLAWTGPAALVLVALVPVAGATAPLQGVVTNCTTRVSCNFVFNTSVGTGWANAVNNVLSFQLPGEAKASYNLSYSTYIARLTGTYTYWTVGSFLGTDVNTGKVVYGTTDTNYTITCHGHSGRGGGCTYTYTTDNGTITIHFTQAEATSTAIACSPTTVKVGSRTSCTVTVKDLWNASHVPTGKMRMTNSLYGNWGNKGNCTLVAGTCTITWHPYDNTVGTVSVSATFPGSSAFYKSSGSTNLYVTGGG